MKDELRSILKRYEQLQAMPKATFLLTAAFNLTIESRGLSELPDADARRMSSAINELQHKLLSQAIKESAGKERYPDDVLFAILGDIAEKDGVTSYAISALSGAIEKVQLS